MGREHTRSRLGGGPGHSNTEGGRELRSGASARSWIQRGVLAVLATAVVVFGLRANGSVANEVTTRDPSVWLVNPPAGTIVRVNRESRDVTTQLEVSTAGQDLAAAQLRTGAVVLERSTGTVKLVSGSTLQTAGRRSLDATGRLHLVSDDESVYAVDPGAGRIVALDTTDLSVLGEERTGTEPALSTASTLDDGSRLWAFDGSSREVLRLGANGAEVARTEVDVDPGALLALAGGRPVLFDRAAGQLVVLDPNDGSVAGRTDLADSIGEDVLVTGSPDGAPEPLAYALTVSEGELLTTNTRTGTAVQLQLEGEEAEAGAEAVYGQPVALGTKLYVPVLSTATVLVVDGADNRIEGSIRLSTVIAGFGDDYELFVEDGAVWFNELGGQWAGVLNDTDGLWWMDKSIFGQQLTAVTGDGDGPGVGDDPSATPIQSAGDIAGEDTDGGPGEARAPTSTPTVTPPDPPLPIPTVLPRPAGPPTGGNGGETNGGGPMTSAGEGSGAPAATTSPTPPVPPAPPAASITVPAGAPLAASFSFAPADPDTTTRVTFQDTSAGRPTRWEWSFVSPTGDTSTATTATVQRALESPGRWSVSLTVSNGFQTISTPPRLIDVREPGEPAPPTPNFRWEVRSPEVNEMFQFTDLSTTPDDLPIIGWNWDFGDGGRSTERNPTHRFATKNTYTVSLTVRNAFGSKVVEYPVQVADAPGALVPSFTINPQVVTAGSPVQFTDTSEGEPTSWTWVFSDRRVITGQTFTISFPSSDPQSVTLTVANARGSATVTRAFEVRVPPAPPKAAIDEPRSPTVAVGRNLRFISGTTGTVTSLTWDWDDGSTSEGATATHSWTTPRTYVVRLTAENEVGRSVATIAVQVTAAPVIPALEPSFVPDPGANAANPARVGQPVRFVNTSRGAGTFQWRFADLSTSTERNPTFSFPRAGSYSVELTMTNAAGSRTATGTVVVRDVPVGEAPAASFDYLPRTVVVGTPVQFVGGTAGAPTSWRWEFEDTVLSGQEVTHAFTRAGTATVTLTVANAGGRNSTTRTIDVQPASIPAPTATFEITPAVAERVQGRSLTFTDVSPDGATLTPAVFTFPTGPVATPPGQRSVQYAFTDAGTFSVSMRVCRVAEPNNCSTSTQTVVVTASRPTASFRLTGIGVVRGPANTVYANQPVTFEDTSTGTVVDRVWEIDGTRYTSANPSVLFPVAGTAGVTLTVSNSAGSTVEGPLTLNVVSTDITAGIGATPLPASVGEVVNFSDNSSGIVTLARWNFGDGSPVLDVLGGGSQPGHAYAAEGSYSVVLTVSNPFTESTTTRLVQVAAAPGTTPTPSLAAAAPSVQISSATGAVLQAPTTATVNDVLTFTETGVSGVVDNVAWTWGDGTARTAGRAATHVFSTPGPHVVRVEVSQGGQIYFTNITIIILPL